MWHSVQFDHPRVKAFSRRVLRWLEAVNPPEWSIVMGTAMLVGIGAGLGAVLFRLLIETAQWVFFDFGAQVFGFLGQNYVLVIPAIGGLIVGPLIYFGAREAKGHGVPEVMEAVALKGGRIRPRVVVIKALASSLSIGSGGSVGREGPIVQIGSALGSTIGQMLNLSDARIRSLVACGAAGGIAATFNAPIAGTIFALEIILGEFQSSYFGAVVISAVIADVIAHIFEGASRAFPVPAYELVNPSELLLYALLGAVAAVVSVIYSRGIYRFEDLFDDWKVPEYVKPAVGGLALGLIGLILVNVGLTFESGENLIPAVFGVGYETITPALLGQLSIGAALALLLLKLLATGLTLGSGASGGVFAPSLFLGAMLGSAFGSVVNMLFPGSTGPVGAYALVGMAAVFAGSAHAPATAILILFEMTGDYRIILPLMFATVISLLLSRALEPESIYTFKLSRRGIRLQYGRDVDLLEGVMVEEAMHPIYDTVSPEMSLVDLVREFERTHHHGFPVVDSNELLVGVVTVKDIDRAVVSGMLDGEYTVLDIATKDDLVVAYPDESLATALMRMGVRGVGRLPVVERETERFIGMLRREGLVRAYNRAIARRSNISHRLEALQQHGSGEVNVVEIKVTPDMACVGKTIGEIAGKFPEHCIIASIQRGDRVLIPHGDTVLVAGDHLTFLARREQSDELQAGFC